ncbi:hypothetical protein F8388_026876 [Cannabis sativa]|uniref:Uncharacterized protein n=1 Tax=Cannabis sativa TaxID=3483 RepID=A0A7J6H1T7_CANSA|nr:hypothetical protein F8388_026876 [Cannabis sativa]
MFRPITELKCSAQLQVYELFLKLPITYGIWPVKSVVSPTSSIRWDFDKIPSLVLLIKKNHLIFDMDNNQMLDPNSVVLNDINKKKLVQFSHLLFQKLALIDDYYVPGFGFMNFGSI